MNVREHLIAQLQHGTGRKSQRLVLDRNVTGVGLNGGRALFNVCVVYHLRTCLQVDTLESALSQYTFSIDMFIRMFNHLGVRFAVSSDTSFRPTLRVYVITQD